MNIRRRTGVSDIIKTVARNIGGDELDMWRGRTASEPIRPSSKGDLGKQKEMLGNPKWGGGTTYPDPETHVEEVDHQSSLDLKIDSTGDNWKRPTFRSRRGWANKKERGAKFIPSTAGRHSDVLDIEEVDWLARLGALVTHIYLEPFVTISKRMMATRFKGVLARQLGNLGCTTGPQLSHTHEFTKCNLRTVTLLLRSLSS